MRQPAEIGERDAPADVQVGGCGMDGQAGRCRQPPSDAKASKPIRPARTALKAHVAARCVGPLVDHGDDGEAAHGQRGEHHPVRHTAAPRRPSGSHIRRPVERLQDRGARGDRIDGDRIQHELDVADAQRRKAASAAAISAAAPRSGAVVRLAALRPPCDLRRRACGPAPPWCARPGSGRGQPRAGGVDPSSSGRKPSGELANQSTTRSRSRCGAR